MTEMGLILAGVLTFIAVLATSEAKPNYEVEFEGVEAVRDPKFVVQTKLFRVAKFNQTSFIINMTADITKDLSKDLVITVTMYEKMASNKYSKIPMKVFNMNLCDALTKDGMVFPELVSKSNLPKEGCPIKKGPFWLRDYFPKMDDLPDHFPGGDRWRADIDYLDSNRLVFRAKVFLFVNRHN